MNSQPFRDPGLNEDGRYQEKNKQRTGHRTHVQKVINSTKELLTTELNGEIESKLKANRTTLINKRDVLETLNN